MRDAYRTVALSGELHCLYAHLPSQARTNNGRSVILCVDMGISGRKETKRLMNSKGSFLVVGKARQPAIGLVADNIIVLSKQSTGTLPQNGCVLNLRTGFLMGCPPSEANR